MMSSGRYAKLSDCEEKVKEKWLKTQQSRLSDLKTLLPSAVTRDTEFLKLLHEKLNQNCADEITQSIRERFDEWNLKEKLDKLDVIVEKAKEDGLDTTEVAWRPSGNPLDDQAAHDIEKIREKHKELNEGVMNSLLEEVSSLHSEIEKLETEIAANESVISQIIEQEI